jgi:mono/diheme cytochrome c family protein
MTRTRAAYLFAGMAACATIVTLVPARLHAFETSFAKIQRGKQLVAVGDCEGCHTVEGGAKFAGGRPLDTPFGVIYSPNITSDPETGIGSWTDAQFYRAMHDGIGPDGTHFYPAFPYPWFTKATRADDDAIHAYLRTLAAVRYRRPPNTLPWPLDIRESMVGWNALYFKPGTYKYDASHSKEWNRGAYLVLGLGHCGACHTPDNFLGAPEGSRRLQGGVLSHWYAPSLAGDRRTGLGSWTQQQIVDFLKNGQTKKGVAYGPMGEVVHYSTSAMDKADLKAIAVYLKSLPAPNNQPAPSRPAANVASAGQAIYVDSCSACHGGDGKGVADMFPPLRGNAVVQGDDPTTVIRLILNGGHAVATDRRPTGVSMPSFGWKFSDREVAAVASYVRSAWGNAASPVSASKVHAVRKSVEDVRTAD